MNIKISKMAIALFFLLIAFYFIISTVGIWKYIFVLDIIILMSMIKLRKRYTWVGFIIMLPSLFYIIYGLFLALMRNNLNFFSFKQTTFYLIPAIAAIFLYNFLSEKTFERIIYIQFWAITAVFFATTYANFTIESLLESVDAFIFGAYTLFFLFKRQYRYGWFSLVLTFVAHKRITLLAVIFCALVIYLFKNLKECKKNRLIKFLFLMNIIFMYLYVYACSSGFIQELMFRYGINSQGRLDVWSIFKQNYDFNFAYLGQGLGWILYELNSLNLKAFDNLHNDILASYIELGFIGFGIWMTLHYSVVNFIRKKKLENKGTWIIGILYIYTFINYSTDNISIYISYWLPLYMIILYISGLKREISDNKLQ